jgi:hypothetical protein
MRLRNEVAVPEALRQSDPVSSMTGSKYTTRHPAGSGEMPMIHDLIDLRPHTNHSRSLLVVKNPELRMNNPLAATAAGNRHVYTLLEAK